MKETDYIVATNRVKISTAKSVICDTFPGDNYGISKAQRKKLLEILYALEDKLFDMIETEE